MVCSIWCILLRDGAHTNLFLQGKSQEMIERLAKMAPLERLGRPEDIANTVSFLAGPDGAWVNGQPLRVNGGIVQGASPSTWLPRH